jgi:hypothetical protein
MQRAKSHIVALAVKLVSKYPIPIDADRALGGLKI